jgi:hypothetical protein
VYPLYEENMHSTITKASSTVEIPSVTTKRDSCPAPAPKEGRCQHRFPNGKRCRKFASGSHFGLCLQHFSASAAVGAGLQQPPNDSLDLSADLLGEPSEFEYAIDINKFLAKLLVLVTKGRISPRRASVLAYITNQLLHSHRAIDRENLLELEADPPRVELGDFPRPGHSRRTTHEQPPVAWAVPAANLDPEKTPS